MSSVTPGLGSRVVAGYDGSQGSVAALEWAVDQANARELPLEVRSVVEPPGMFAIDVLGAGWADESQAVADQLAREGAERALRTADVTVTAAAVVGHPSAGLVDGSQTATLLVLGAHGFDSGPSVLIGNVAFAVTVHARCPVAVVRGAPPRRAGPGAPVVVGVDGSRSATAAVLEGADLAARAGAELVIVSAWRAPGLRRWGSDRDDTWNQRHAEDPVRLAAESVVRAEADRAKHVHSQLTVSTSVLEGTPAQVLTELSTSAGAVVVGSRGRGGFAGLLLGSVTRRLLHQAHCPVLVVRRVPERVEERHQQARADVEPAET